MFGVRLLLQKRESRLALWKQSRDMRKDLAKRNAARLLVHV